MTHERPLFDNQIFTLELAGREALLRMESSTPDSPDLRVDLERHLS